MLRNKWRAGDHGRVTNESVKWTHSVYNFPMNAHVRILRTLEAEGIAELCHIRGIVDADGKPIRFGLWRFEKLIPTCPRKELI